MIKELIRDKKVSEAYTMLKVLTYSQAMNILLVIDKANCSVNNKQIAEAVGEPQPRVSDLLIMMRKAGIVKVNKKSAKKTYSINYERVGKISEAVKQFNKETK